METAFDHIIKAFKDLPQQIPGMFIELIQGRTEEIEDKNTDQLMRGERADGVILPDYSPTSVGTYGKPAGPIRLYDQGDFHRGIRVTQIDSTGFMMEGTDYKTPELAYDYGKDIIGLTEESLDEITQDFILLDLQDLINDYFDERI